MTASDNLASTNYASVRPQLSMQEQAVLDVLVLFEDGITTHECTTLLGISSGHFTRIITTLRRLQVQIGTQWVTPGRDKAARLGPGASKAKLYWLVKA